MVSYMQQLRECFALRTCYYAQALLWCQPLNYAQLQATVSSTLMYRLQRLLTFPGATRIARGDIRLVHGLTKSTLITYFSGMKIDPKYTFLHAFFLICLSCSFQNLSIWPKTHPFSNFAHFCTPKRCTRVQCLVLKNNRNYVNFWTSLIPPWHSSAHPRADFTRWTRVYQNSWAQFEFGLQFTLNSLNFTFMFCTNEAFCFNNITIQWTFWAMNILACTLDIVYQHTVFSGKVRKRSCNSECTFV